MIAPCILIPVYNHGATLRSVVESALHFLPHVIVVDDGSTDGGARNIADLPVLCLSLGENKGKGAALRAGAEEARKRGFTHIITMDADGQHSAHDIPLFLEAIQREPLALIVGKRDFTGPNIPASSRFGRRFSWFWMFIQTGVEVSDVQSGFRAYPLQLLEAIHCTETRYSFEVEVLVRAAWAGFGICECDIHVYYPKAEERISHFDVFYDNLRITILNTRLTIRALLPLPFRRPALEKLSLRHPLRSLRQLKGSPGHLAKSSAWSLFISSLPLPGLQTIILLFCVARLRLNRLCALLMVPLTWPPLVPALAIFFGYRLLYGQWMAWSLDYKISQFFFAWLAGCLCIAPVLALIGGVVVYCLTRFLCSGGETER